MTTLQKALIAATLAAAVGTGIYEARRAAQLHSRVLTLQQQQSPLTDEIQQLKQERDDASNRLATLAEENARLNRNTPELMRLRGEVGRSRNVAESEPPPKPGPASIPVPTNETELREVKNAMMTAMGRIGFALRQYMTNNPYGVFIDQAGQLNLDVFTNSPALPLEHFEIQVADAQHLALSIQQAPEVIIARSKEPISFDGRYTYFYLLADGSVRATTLGLTEQPIKNGFLLPNDELKRLAEANDPERLALTPALEAFSKIHGGEKPNDPAQLLPYVTTPEQEAILKKAIERREQQGRQEGEGRLKYEGKVGRR